MDFLQMLKRKVESFSYTPPVALIGAYDTSRDSIALRPTPSDMQTRYINDDKVYPYSFQILVHHKNSMSAYDLAMKLQNEFEKSKKDFIKSDDNSFTLINISVTTTVNHVERTGYGDLWTAIFVAELIIKGDDQ